VRFNSTSSTSDVVKPHYDVVIAGGGLVGVSLAVSLGKYKQNKQMCFKSIMEHFT
jgi:thioredoxin reductase